MTELWLSLILPLILVAVLLINKSFRKRTAIWEPIVPFAVVLLIIVFFKWIGVSSVTKDYEYWGNYVVETRYYEPWDEYIQQTCTRSYACGTDANGNTTYCTETYDCSYVDYHSEYWSIILNDKSEIRISESYYNKLVNQFGSSKIFVNMYRDYHSQDGDMYATDYLETYETFEPWMSKHKYKNKVQASTSTFNFTKVSEEDVKTYNLFEYPDVNDGELNAILTHGYEITKAEQDKFNYLNGKLGMEKQVRVWILLFEPDEKKSVYLQESYWVGGNKNEFVICLGMNYDGTVQWYEPFGWNKEKLIEIETRDYLLSGDTLDFLDFGDFMYNQVEKNWVRTSFEEFEYLTIEPPLWAILGTWIVSFLLSIGIGVWIVLNKFTTIDPQGFRSRYFQYKRK